MSTFKPVKASKNQVRPDSAVRHDGSATEPLADDLHRATTADVVTRPATGPLADLPIPSFAPWVHTDGGLGDSYRKGDLIYGTTSARAAVMQELLPSDKEQFSRFREEHAEYIDGYAPGRGGYLLDQKGAPNLAGASHLWIFAGPTGEPVTIDGMNNEFLGLGNAQWTGEPTDWYFGPQALPDNVPARLHDYAQKLHRSRYSPTKTRSPSEEHMNARLRRSCKFGIEYTVKRGQNIHFVLDGLRMGDVNESGFSTGVLSDKRHAATNRNYTGSELRYIYRNRHRQDFRERVHFWRDGLSAAPPWEDPVFAEQFARYEPKSLTVDDGSGNAVKVPHAAFREAYGVHADEQLTTAKQQAVADAAIRAEDWNGLGNAKPESLTLRERPKAKKANVFRRAAHKVTKRLSNLIGRS